MYLDNVISISSDLTHSKHRLSTILELIEDARNTLSLEKSRLFRLEVDYLGYIIKPGILEVSSGMIAAVQEATPYRIVREVISS